MNATTNCFAKLRKMGVRIILIADGDIAGSIVTCLPDSGVDLLIGAGAGAEATIAATAVKCLGGTMLVKVWKDKKDDPKRMDRLKAAGVDVEKTYTEDELAKGNEMIFAASGVTKGEMLDGVRFTSGGAKVQSILHTVAKRNHRVVRDHTEIQRTPNLQPNNLSPLFWVHFSFI